MARTVDGKGSNQIQPLRDGPAATSAIAPLEAAADADVCPYHPYQKAPRGRIIMVCGSIVLLVRSPKGTTERIIYSVTPDWSVPL